MNKKTINWLKIGFFSALFLFFYIWFTKVHPLVIFDADDWTYLVPDRKAWPIIGEWNPAKVFPEVFMPFCSTIGAFLLMPAVGDYVSVMTITHGFVVSVFLTGYLFCFYKMMQRLFDFGEWECILSSLIFLMFHFLALRSGYEDNNYLFLCEDVNCYYNYLIPGVLNAGIVMVLVGNEKFKGFLQGEKYALKGIFLLIAYMAIFSNLVDSILLAVYAGAVLLVGILKDIKGFNLKNYIKKFAFPLILFAVWFISALFELTGGRMTTSEGVSGSLLVNFKDTLFYLKEMLLSCNRLFLVVCVAVCAASLWANRGKMGGSCGQTLLLWVVCVGAEVAVMCALCAMVDPVYMTRSEYLFGIFFYCLVLVMLLFGQLLKTKPQVMTVLPILLCVLLSATNTKGKTFRESNMENLPPAVCAGISRSLVEQVVAADQQGKTETDLIVPKWDSEDNWPHATVLIHRVSYPLYEHGIAQRPIALNPVPGYEVK